MVTAKNWFRRVSRRVSEWLAPLYSIPEPARVRLRAILQSPTIRKTLIFFPAVCSVALAGTLFVVPEAFPTVFGLFLMLIGLGLAILGRKYLELRSRLEEALKDSEARIYIQTVHNKREAAPAEEQKKIIFH